MTIPLPPLLQEQWRKAAERLALEPDSLSDRQKAVFAGSDFVVDNLAHYPQWAQALDDQPPQPAEWQHYAAWLAQRLDPVQDENGLMRELRLFRREMLVRIAWMQTLSLCSTVDSLQQLSALAETVIVAARDWLWQACCADLGTPCNAEGEPQPLLILGMGKLGGGELNFSSDIDLIFTWPENGSTRGGRRELDNAPVFHPSWPAANQSAGSADHRWLCLSGRHAFATLWRQRTAGAELCRAGRLLSGAGTRLGTLRDG